MTMTHLTESYYESFLPSLHYEVDDGSDATAQSATISYNVTTQFAVGSRLLSDSRFVLAFVITISIDYGTTSNAT